MVSEFFIFILLKQYSIDSVEATRRVFTRSVLGWCFVIRMNAGIFCGIAKRVAATTVTSLVESPVAAEKAPNRIPRVLL